MKEVKEVAEAHAKESLNCKITNAGDRPKNVRRRRDFSPSPPPTPSPFPDISILHLFPEFATRFGSDRRLRRAFFTETSEDTAVRRGTGATTGVASDTLFSGSSRPNELSIIGAEF